MAPISEFARNCILGSALTLAMLASLGTAHAGSFRVLHAFAGGSDGAYPEAGLIKDSAGNLYGTTEIGGGTNDGTVFELAPDGTETVLLAFTGGSDGYYPVAGLIKDSAGNLYGTTYEGGSSGCDGYGCGIVFKLAPDGTERVLHTFAGGSDGAGPEAGLIKDSAGKLYGTTVAGGSSGCDGYGCGTVFKLAPDGTERVLHTFAGGSDGAGPEAGLIKDSAGKLYGTTVAGGSSGCEGYGCGTVFKLAPDGTETVLHTFAGQPTDGYLPHGLIRDSAGNLYGTTEGGGSTGNGTVFKLAPDGTETVLFSFGGSGGALPSAGLIRDSAGTLYGTTYWGGTGCDGHGCGTVFKLAPDGTETVLYSFTGGSDGAYPYAGLIKDAAGYLYSTTSTGGGTGCGGDGCGAVFKLKK